MAQPITKSIIATVAYYDVLDYPLTALEVWKYLFVTGQNSIGMRNFTLVAVVRELESEAVRRFVGEKSGFYYLLGREDLVDQRLIRNKVAVLKFKRLRRTVSFFRFVPFVRMIGITGRLAMKNTIPASDWDVFVVLKAGRIWTGRTLVTLAAHLMGKRRHGEYVENRVCLNYFVTDAALEIRTKDFFSAHEYFFLLPLFGRDMFRKFQLANRWIEGYKPNYTVSDVSYPIMLPDPMLIRWFRVSGEWLLGRESLERWFRSWQSKKIQRNPKTHLRESMVDATDEALVFLPEPRGPQVFEQFQQRIESLGRINRS